MVKLRIDSGVSDLERREKTKMTRVQFIDFSDEQLELWERLREIVQANSPGAVDSAMPPKEDAACALCAAYFDSPTLSVSWGELRRLLLLT
jgi:hypothetical protein